jgi:hypothetical protein
MLYALYEISQDMHENISTAVKGVYESIEDGLNAAKASFEAYKNEFPNGNEIIEYSSDRTSMRIKYTGGCQPADWNTVYVMRPYEINTFFEDCQFFDNEFYNNLSSGIINLV